MSDFEFFLDSWGRVHMAIPRRFATAFRDDVLVPMGPTGVALELCHHSETNWSLDQFVDDGCGNRVLS